MVEKGLSDLAYNLTYTYATIVLLFTVPFTGFLLDTKLRRITGLRWSTLLAVLSYAFCAIAGLLNKPELSLGLFSAGMYFYLLTFSFYTPLLSDIAHEHEIGKISGLGIAWNYIGQFAGLLLALPFANGAIPLFGASHRLEALLPATILYLLFSLPMLIWFQEPYKAGEIGEATKQYWRSVLRKSKELFTYKSVAYFFLAYFFFNDAVLTAANNFPIFVEQVWHVSDLWKSVVLGGIVFTSAIGGYFGGKISDRIGHKKTLMIILIGWVVILPVLGYATTFAFFLAATTCMGLWFGASWAVSRSVMSYLTPTGAHNLAFGYFGLIERTSSLLGPIAWGLTVSGLVSIGSERYRVAVLVITAFIVFGIMALKRVKSDRV